jgi:hypothetical protein
MFKTVDNPFGVVTIAKVGEGPAKIVLTHATLAASDPKTTEFLLDIDAVWDSKSMTDQAEILNKAAVLHDCAGDVFEVLPTKLGSSSMIDSAVTLRRPNVIANSSSATSALAFALLARC